MLVYRTNKQRLYYDRVLKAHLEQGLGIKKIVKLFPISRNTVRSWIRSYYLEEESLRREAHRMPKTSRSDRSPQPPEFDELRALREENARLKKQMAWETMRADAFEEMINIAEKRFSIPIRKKPGAKQ